MKGALRFLAAAHSLADQTHEFGHQLPPLPQWADFACLNLCSRRCRSWRWMVSDTAAAAARGKIASWPPTAYFHPSSRRRRTKCPCSSVRHSSSQRGNKSGASSLQSHLTACLPPAPARPINHQLLRSSRWIRVRARVERRVMPQISTRVYGDRDRGRQLLCEALCHGGVCGGRVPHKPYPAILSNMPSNSPCSTPSDSWEGGKEQLKARHAFAVESVRTFAHTEPFDVQTDGRTEAVRHGV